MITLLKISLSTALLMISLPVLGSAPVSDDAMSASQTTQEAEQTILLAKKRKKKSRKVREKNITREAKQNSRDSKNIDFDAANIGGATKAPMSSLIGQNKADKNYDFIKIRLRWHPEMIQSASSLNSGK